jgi:cytochrome c2
VTARRAELAVALFGALSAGEAAAGDDIGLGQVVFQRCAACHAVDPGESPLPGPSLFGVVGRPAGSRPGFDYSPILRAAKRDGLVWTEAALDLYLRDTEAFLPGSVMGFQRIEGADDRRALIAYLRAAAPR